MDINKEKTEFTEEEKKNIIYDLIMEGYSTFSVTRFGKSWTFRTLTDKIKLECHDLASAEVDENIKWSTYMLYIVKKSLIAINNIPLDEEVASNICSKLPRHIILELYHEQQRLDDLSRDIINNVGYIQNIVKEDSFSKIKFMVMKEFGALPTEQRVKDMTDQQWFWCYYNLIESETEDIEKKKHIVDYLSFFINPELASRIQQDNKNKQGINNASSEQTIQHQDGSKTVINYGEGITDNDFDMKLRHAMGENPTLIELDDDCFRGTKNESESDFIKRAQQFEAKMQELQNQAKQDAQSAGVNENDFDIIAFEEEED